MGFDSTVASCTMPFVADMCLQLGPDAKFSIGLDKTTYPGKTKATLAEVQSAGFSSFFNTNRGLPDLGETMIGWVLHWCLLASSGLKVDKTFSTSFAICYAYTSHNENNST